MDCPFCKNDLTKLETEENILTWHTCKKCKNEVWLDFEVAVDSDKLIDKFVWSKTRNTDEE
jgi:Zn-finger nucleic acid-binding protein